MKYKIISLIVLVLCLISLANCTGNSTERTETTDILTSQATIETDYLDTLPEKNYDDIAFNIIGVDYPTRRNFPNEEEVGEIVNDALSMRNLIVEERNNIIIKSFGIESASILTSTVQNSILAGDTEYDLIISDIASSLAPLMKSNLLYNLRDIPYLNLSTDWWSSGIYENASYQNKQYITIGDLSKTVLDGKWT